MDEEAANETDTLQKNFDFEFSDQSIRHGFIKKVYGILICQLTVTIIFIAMFLYIIITFVCIIVLACCPDVRRSSPTNFIVLSVFTICESFLLGSAASHYNAEAVLWAVLITAAVSIGLTVFAMQTKYDFTMCSGGLLVLLICLFMLGFLAVIIRNHYLNLVYASLGALVFGMYLVFDTQMMMGGKHQYAISPEEYIFAALNLYLDIINLFLFILQLFNRN